MARAKVLILEGARTPFATWSSGTRGDGQRGGTLRVLDPFDLGAMALKGALEKAGLAPSQLGKVIFGNMYQVGPHACYGGRYVCHRAGLPPEIPCLAVGLACGTGLQAIVTAAEEIARGEARVAAVGADSASLVRREVFVPSFKDISCGRHIAETAQALAREYGFSRQDQDRWALLSHLRAREAKRRGTFQEEILPASGLAEDDAVLAEPSEGHFERSRLLFEGGTATHANTHAIVDGGSALILASESAAADSGVPPLGRYLGDAVIGLPPEKMAYASVEAIRALLRRLDLTIGAIDLFEINETFAAQVLIDLRELDLPEERLNVNGGALALGHPFAGTGCRLVLTLLKELRRRGMGLGIASISIGGGLGIAVAVEAA